MLSVVTGASGFLGGILVRDLLARGDRVRAVDLVHGQALEGLDVEWQQADVLDPSTLDTAMRGADSVYHLAAVISVTGDPTGRVWDTNVHGVRNTAEAALKAGVERFVHCSSIHAFDISAVEEVSEESPRSDNPKLPAYDRSKAAGERELHQVIAAGLDGVICNPTAIIGPGDFTDSRMNSVIEAMFERNLPALIEGGFDWVDGRDVSNSLIEAGRTGRTGENYLLGGHHATVEELAGVVGDVTGLGMPRLTLPMWFARMWSPLGDIVGRRTGNPLSYTTESLHALRSDPHVSSAKAQEELHHTARPLAETVADMYAWTRGHCDTG